MRYLILLLFIISCSESIEENCFEGSKEKRMYKEEKPFTTQQILDSKPDYLQIVSLKYYRSFKQDSIDGEYYYYENQKVEEEKWIKKNEDYKQFYEKFMDQFSFFAKQKIGNIQYCLGKNVLGYWLLKIENGKPSAYFLGLSYSHYYLNKIQQNPIIKNGFLQVEGSFVKIIKVGGLPGYDDYSAIDDGKLFKINLNDLMKDSDNDGYNDIFENCFGLNPDNKDSDGDGIDDYEDLNPMFKSEKSKFTQLYEELLPNYGDENLINHHYFFEVFESDCDYFHKINPKYHVLFIPSDSKLKSDYVRNTDVTRNGISKIKRNKNNPNIFYITEWGNSYSNDNSAEYKDGKWIIEIVGGYII